MLDRDAEISLLYDFYGSLLSARQRDAVRLSHEENLSLSEIAEEYGISRQAVHDALKNGQQALEQYEAKLGLVRRFEEQRQTMEKIRALLESLRRRAGEECDPDLREMDRLLSQLGS